MTAPDPAGRTPLRPHALIATLLEPERNRLLAALQKVPPATDLAEIRLDGLWHNTPSADAATDDLIALLDVAPVPLLATLRPRRQGGLFEGPEDVRLGLLQAALRAGFSHADLELDGLDMPGRVAALRPYGSIVLSLHLAGEAPCRSDGMQPLLAMQDLQPALEKLAFTASAFPDLLRALEFARAHRLRGGKPAIATLQHGGAPLRAAAALAGNAATYGHAQGVAPAAPGQPALSEIAGLWQQWGLTREDLDHCAQGQGKWLAVLGMPVEGSQSPRLHNAWLRAAKRPERFGALDVPASASALRLALHAAPRIGLVGVSVMAPHKQDAARIAQGDAIVQATGAANCLRMAEDGTIAATNTDATAVARLAKSHVQNGSSALVLGSGALACAAVWALKSLGAHVTVAARNDGRAATFHALGATTIAWADRAQAKADAIVQATPLRDAVVSTQSLAARPWILEAVYRGGPTSLQQTAAQAGCPVTDGLQLLEEQGRDAYRFWFGVDAPRGPT